MAVAIRQTTPFGLDVYDQIQEKLSLQGNPPEGLILHTAGAVDDGVAIFNIWESEAAFQTFREQRLLPAVAEVAGEEAAQGPPADQQIYELHNVVRP